MYYLKQKYQKLLACFYDKERLRQSFSCGVASHAESEFGACVVFLRTFLVDIHKLYIDLDLKSSLFYCASFVICFQFSGSSLFFSFP